MLRLPLEHTSGTLRAPEQSYDPALVNEVLAGPSLSAQERLAVYHRQYWFRLFSMLQNTFSLTMQLLGPWQFNRVASDFLLARPPQHWELEHAARGFEEFVASSYPPEGARGEVAEAARLDACWRALFFAASAKPFQPSANDAPRLLDAYLVRSASVEIFVEQWPLLVLKTMKPSMPQVLKRLEQPQAWLLVREERGIRTLLLHPREAELLQLLERYPVREALAQLEAHCENEERTQLPANAQRWLASSVQRGCWSGMRWTSE